MSNLWSRRNFIRISALCAVAAAVPVAAAKAATKAATRVVGGWISEIEAGGRIWKCQLPEESDADFRARVGEELAGPALVNTARARAAELGVSGPLCAYRRKP